MCVLFGPSFPPVVCKKSHVLFTLCVYCLHIVVPNTYCALLLFYFSSVYVVRFSGLSIFNWPFVNLQNEFEDSNGVISIRKSKKDRQHNGQKKKVKQRSIKHTHKTKYRVTQTLLKTGGELRCSGRVGSSFSMSC